LSTRYKIVNPTGAYFITTAVVGWIDIFTRQVYVEIVLDSLRYCIKEKGLQLHAYVIMSNHLHLIVSANGKDSLSDIMRDFKKFTSKQILKAISTENESRRELMLTTFRMTGTCNSHNSTFQFWQQDNHPIELNANVQWQQKLNYIHQNPVRAGWVRNAEDYLNSSAGAYLGLSEDMPLVYIE
jgi:REP element-mobilizing transposase RayT